MRDCFNKAASTKHKRQHTSYMYTQNVPIKSPFYKCYVCSCLFVFLFGFFFLCSLRIGRVLMEYYYHSTTTDHIGYECLFRTHSYKQNDSCTSVYTHIYSNRRACNLMTDLLFLPLLLIEFNGRGV